MSRVAVFPNPTSDYINFTSEKEIIKAISIYDCDGRILNQLKIAGQQTLVAMSVQTLPVGLYFAQIITSNGAQMVKFERI